MNLADDDQQEDRNAPVHQPDGQDQAALYRQPPRPAPRRAVDPFAAEDLHAVQLGGLLPQINLAVVARVLFSILCCKLIRPLLQHHFSSWKTSLHKNNNKFCCKKRVGAIAENIRRNITREGNQITVLLRVGPEDSVSYYDHNLIVDHVDHNVRPGDDYRTMAIKLNSSLFCRRCLTSPGWKLSAMMYINALGSRHAAKINLEEDGDDLRDNLD